MILPSQQHGWVSQDVELERRILEMLRGGLTSMLEAYATDLEEDEAAERRWAPHVDTLAAVSAWRRRTALGLRISEKRILNESIQV